MERKQVVLENERGEVVGVMTMEKNLKTKKSPVGSIAIVLATILCLGAVTIYPTFGLIWLSTTDPTTAGGVSAPLNQILVRTDSPSMYYKSGAANTAWTQVGLGSAATTTLIQANDAALFSIGIDGDCNFDGVANPVCGYTLAGTTYTAPAGRLLYARNITISSGITVNPAGHEIMANGTITGPGKIARNGTDAVGGAGGGPLAASSIPGCTSGGANGGGAGPGASAASIGVTAPQWCVTGGVGGAGGAAGNPGGVGAACQGGGGGGQTVAGNGGNGGGMTVRDRWGLTHTNLWLGRDQLNALYQSASGGGGGAGTGGNGGGGGGCGGWVVVMAADCGTGNWTVEARGGNGADGTVATSGGGGGGGGGRAIVYCGRGTPPAVNTCGGGGGDRGGATAGSGGRGGAGRSDCYSPSTGWTTCTPVVTPCPDYNN